jgi:Ca2+-binding EF-hand superfamily protein
LDGKIKSLSLFSLPSTRGQNEGGFSEEQKQMYKDCFKLMDINKDGNLDKNDLRGAFDNVGVLMSEGELDGLLGEISGACSCDAMIKMFEEKMAGEGNDPDDLIVQAFKAYDNEGKIDSKMFEHALKTWGDKMTKAEIDDIFGEFEIDEDYCIKTKDIVGLFVAVKEEPKVEEVAVVEEAAPEEDEEDADAKKKKKKKKKAAK